MKRVRKLKKGWKVVGWEGESPCTTEGSVQYELFCVTKPQQGYGPLAVFKDLRGAENFKKHLCCDTAIFPILYVPSKTRALHYANAEGFSDIRKLLKVNPTALLPGTMDFADIVILLPQREEC